MPTLTYLSFEQFCETIQIPSELANELIELGILSPIGASPSEWQFSHDMLGTARKSLQLHRQLEIDLPGIAVAIQLLDKIDRLESENRQLRRLYQRFIETDAG